ncbi:PREDICTED: potassium/sodium hyperpolarization-activated cyclic nucleotide-gated channel 1-like [Ceratosolen solmsi marchali]|uniref:Potassium/sodium hyperpolarization-activated cyclic nucleotide-gated channel 1-like n=1 Tax=Ceratosolen solmsi marchali TaxID=326594 RepID=A0AAJ6YFT5_9HYME|nr:PREDICTED: potassium/sodium hyperpolarization-activated cyclic nucleotide-gated channel 1-like [Ceratosolen solmsi marchali]
MFHWKKLKSIQHICDLIKNSESHLLKLPPNAELIARFKRRLQKNVLVSTNHPLTRFYLRSKAAIALEKHRHGMSSNWWIIHPCSHFRFAWDSIMAFTFLYMFFMIPHMISFHWLSKNKSDIINKFNILTPGFILCLIDIFFNFITGFISPDGHEIFIDPLVILQFVLNILYLVVGHYIGRLFFIDLTSSIPYVWLHKNRLENPGSGDQLYLLFFEMLPLLKLFRLCTLRHYIKEILLACEASRVYEHGVWIFWLTILIFHWSACFTYAFPFFYAYIMKTTMNKGEGYIFKTKLYEKPDWIIYLTSLYIGGGNLCSYSFTEFKFTDLPDKITRCILLLFGMTYFLYVIVIILQLVKSSVEPELKYQSIMNGVNDYINNKRLPKKLKERLLHFYEHRFQGSLFKEKAITSTLSKHLKREITQYSSSILFESTLLFNNISCSFLNSIIGVLKQEIFLQDDIIYKYDIEGKCMYFIITGTVALITYSGKEICHVNDGDFFGENAVVQHEHKRETTAIALEVCEVLRFDRRDFVRLVPPKCEMYKAIESLADALTQHIKNAENQVSNDDDKINGLKL